VEEDAIDAVASDDGGAGKGGRGLPASRLWSGGGDDDFGRRKNREGSAPVGPTWQHTTEYLDLLRSVHLGLLGSRRYR
jgi:hypothetical protein